MHPVDIHFRDIHIYQQAGEIIHPENRGTHLDFVARLGICHGDRAGERAFDPGKLQGGLSGCHPRFSGSHIIAVRACLQVSQFFFSISQLLLCHCQVCLRDSALSLIFGLARDDSYNSPSFVA